MVQHSAVRIITVVSGFAVSAALFVLLAWTADNRRADVTLLSPKRAQTEALDLVSENDIHGLMQGLGLASYPAESHDSSSDLSSWKVNLGLKAEESPPLTLADTEYGSHQSADHWSKAKNAVDHFIDLNSVDAPVSHSSAPTSLNSPMSKHTNRGWYLFKVCGHCHLHFSDYYFCFRTRCRTRLCCRTAAST